MHPSLVFGLRSEAVARAIIASGAYLINEDIYDKDKFFTWKSGIEAPVYTDCRVLNRNPGAREIVKKSLGDSIRQNYPDAEYIIGIAEAGVVWSAYAADEASLPHGFVRKQPKKHGRGQKLVECDPPEGVKAVIVDDLVGSGGSVLKAVNALIEEKNIQVIGVQSIVNWNFEGMRNSFNEHNITCRCLVSYPQLLEEALREKIITREMKSILTSFYQDPRNHVWEDRNQHLRVKVS